MQAPIPISRFFCCFSSLVRPCVKSHLIKRPAPTFEHIPNLNAHGQLHDHIRYGPFTKYVTVFLDFLIPPPPYVIVFDA